MFDKLREKLKSSLSFFSKKVEEEVEKPEVAVQKPSAQDLLDEVAPEVTTEPVETVEVKKRAQTLIEETIEEPEAPKKVESQWKPTETKPVHVEEKKAEQPRSFFSKAKEALTTKRLSAEKFDELFWSLEQALLENNVAVAVIDKIKEDLKAKLIEKPLPRNLEDVVQKTLNESLDEVLSVEQQDFMTLARSKKPFVIAFFGINGSGKTTTIAKIAHLLQQNKLSCVMAAGDTFRAAAIQQLEEHADNLKIKIIKHDYGADAAAVAFDAVKHAQKHGIDVVLIDTAGRLHSDVNLMDELKKIVRVAKPDLKLFVGESITGNDCVEQAERFDEHIGIDGVILTKADVDEKGGTALSISFVTKKPIMYIGTGQRYGDLKQFSKEMVLENLGLATSN